jgi:hypothetical protein
VDTAALALIDTPAANIAAIRILLFIFYFSRLNAPTGWTARTSFTTNLFAAYLLLIC